MNWNLNVSYEGLSGKKMSQNCLKTKQSQYLVRSRNCSLRFIGNKCESKFALKLDSFLVRVRLFRYKGKCKAAIAIMEI